MMEPGTAGVAGVVGAIARELQVTLVQLCGSGAYGQVWLVVDDSGWRRALKVVNLAGNAQEVNRGSILDDIARDAGLEAPRSDYFKMIHPDTCWQAGLEHGEKLGLGTRAYELVKI